MESGCFVEQAIPQDVALEYLLALAEDPRPLLDGLVQRMSETPWHASVTLPGPWTGLIGVRDLRTSLNYLIGDPPRGRGTGRGCGGAAFARVSRELGADILVLEDPIPIAAQRTDGWSDEFPRAIVNGLRYIWLQGPCSPPAVESAFLEVTVAWGDLAAITTAPPGRHGIDEVVALTRFFVADAFDGESMLGVRFRHG